MRIGERRTVIRLEVESPILGVRVLTCNISPIVDGAGKRRSVLATFDDTSDTEMTNEGLREALEKLEEAHACCVRWVNSVLVGAFSQRNCGLNPFVLST